MTAVPEANCIEAQINHLDKFQLIQRIQQQFRIRWQQEYISELQLHTKWNTYHQPLKEGTLAVIKKENTPPFRWPLGRVVQVFPGPDGIN